MGDDAVIWDPPAIVGCPAEEEAGIWADNVTVRAFVRCASA